MILLSMLIEFINAQLPANAISFIICHVSLLQSLIINFLITWAGKYNQHQSPRRYSAAPLTIVAIAMEWVLNQRNLEVTVAFDAARVITTSVCHPINLLDSEKITSTFVLSIYPKGKTHPKWSKISKRWNLPREIGCFRKSKLRLNIKMRKTRALQINLSKMRKKSKT